MRCAAGVKDLSTQKKKEVDSRRIRKEGERRRGGFSPSSRISWAMGPSRRMDRPTKKRGGVGVWVWVWDSNKNGCPGPSALGLQVGANPREKKQKKKQKHTNKKPAVLLPHKPVVHLARQGVITW
jgi:hypothetical protein